jgi:predicted nucleic acid-binding protein
LALCFLDTSALVKLYVREPGTDWLLRLASHTTNHRFVVLALSRVEFRSAIQRRERAGDIDGGLAKGLIDKFEQHLETRFLRQSLNESVLDAACELIDRYPLRAYDAIQLAGCLILKITSGVGTPIFVCSDRNLIRTAESEGLSSVDPVNPPA